MPSPAEAGTCPPAVDLRVQLGTSPPSILDPQWGQWYGVVGNIWTYDPQVVCYKWVNSVSIVSDANNWVEAGWRENQFGSLAFIAVKRDRGIYEEHTFSCVGTICLGHNEVHTYKLRHPVSNMKWSFKVDGVEMYNATMIFSKGHTLAHQEREYIDSNDVQGSAFNALKRANNANTFEHWQTIGCWSDNDNDYKYEIIYPYKFRVTQGDGSTNCTPPQL